MSEYGQRPSARPIRHGAYCHVCGWLVPAEGVTLSPQVDIPLGSRKWRTGSAYDGHDAVRCFEVAEEYNRITCSSYFECDAFGQPVYHDLIDGWAIPGVAYSRS